MGLLYLSVRGVKTHKVFLSQDGDLKDASAKVKMQRLLHSVHYVLILVLKA
jgi:hypothetical protein